MMNVPFEKSKIILKVISILSEQPSNEIDVLKCMRRLNYLKGIERGQDTVLEKIDKLWNKEEDFSPAAIRRALESSP